MCLIFVAIDQHPEYPLLVAANRDEFYARETQQAHRWERPSGLIAGKDLTGGGTWLGVDNSHGLAMLTNYRDPGNVKSDAPTRGTLVTDYFHANGPEAYLQEVSKKGANYNGFNLICGNLNGFYYYGNYSKGIKKLEKGVHGLSNALLDEPWPKIETGKARMSEMIGTNDIDIESFMKLMLDDHQAPDADLPETGVGQDLERVLSSMFIKSPNYGSRCTTVIRVNIQGVVEYVERTFDTQTFEYQDTSYQLEW